VRVARRDLGMSEAELARMAGFRHRSAISGLETGRDGVSMPKVLRLLDILGIDIESLFSEDG